MLKESLTWEGEAPSQAQAKEPPPAGALPIVFGPPERPLLGFYHAPEGVSVRPVAVVLCNPLGFEAMSAHRTYRHLAERLAARGFPALRFDYDGTGDSAGRLDDPGRLRGWIASIKAAISEARARAGTQPVALFGVRFGATLATLAAAEEGDIDDLISWGPVISGRLHVRELRAFQLLLKGSKAPARRSDGGEEVGGYIFTAETLADMSAVDLLTTTKRVARRVLVVPRSERSREEGRLIEHLTTCGSEVRLLPKGGYSGMMRDDPYDTAVPFETLDAMVEWLAEGNPPAPRGPAPERESSNVLVAARRGKTAAKETALLFGEGERLFGVLTEPDGATPRDRPVLCFLNVGANHHVGPHRMSVELAREMASRGYASFRLDAAGLGDSRVAPGVRENRIYTKDSVADVQSAMTLLGEMRGNTRFVVIGLCSGAYLAFHTAIVDPRVVGQVLLSPFAFEWKEGDPVTPTTRKPFRSTRYYARSLLDHSVWLRALRGDVKLWSITGVLLERLQTRIDLELPLLSARLGAKRRPQNDVEQAFRAMSERGVESLMVLSFEDSGVDMVAEYLGTDARRMRGRKNFSLQIVEEADHTFTTLASQNKLRELLTDYVSTRFP
jgi:alpha-beta hydrolase superfamily lysophospholipase